MKFTVVFVSLLIVALVAGPAAAFIVDTMRSIASAIGG
jgi:hypothetical protein